MGAPKKIKVQVNEDLEDIMPLFLKRLHEDVASMKDAFAKKNFKAIASFGHRLRGNGPSYGIIELGPIGYELEKSAKENNFELCMTVFEKIKDYVNRLEVEFVKQLGGN